MALDGEPDPIVTSDAGRRRGAWGRFALRSTLLTLLLTSIWLFLWYLARCDREGRETLFQLSTPMKALLSTGALLSRTAESHVALIRSAVLALAVLGAVLLVWRWKGELRRALPCALPLPLLMLSAAFFLPPPARVPAFLGSLAAGVSLLFLRDGPSNNVSLSGSAKALVLIPLGIAAALRFFALAEVPRGFSDHPVIHHLSLTFRYLEEAFPMLTAGQWGAATHWIGQFVLNERLGFTCLLDALGFELLGVSLVTARLISAAAGCLTVLVAYFLGTQLQDRRLGILFSFLLAVSPWHVTVSRYGDLEHVVSPLQLLLALGFYAAAIRNGRLRDYLLSAVFLGLSWFVYPPNLVVPLIVGLHLALLLVLNRGLLRRERWKIGAFALLFGLISYAPVSKMLREGFLRPGARTGYQGMENISFADAGRNWKMLVGAGKQLFVQVGDPWFSKPGGGLSLTEATLFLPGVLLCVGGLFVPARRWRSSLVLLAVPISILPGILAPDESIRRLYLTTTLALLLASLVISRSLDALAQLGFRRRSRLFAVAFFAVAVGAVNAHIYFHRARADSEDGATPLTEMSKCVRTSIGREFIYVYGAPKTESAFYHRYISLAAYEPLNELFRRGLKQEDLYEIVFGADILDALKDPRRIQGRFRVLAEESLVASRADGFDVRTAIFQAFSQAQEESIGPVGQRVLRSWRIR